MDVYNGLYWGSYILDWCYCRNWFIVYAYDRGVRWAIFKRIKQLGVFATLILPEKMKKIEKESIHFFTGKNKMQSVELTHPFVMAIAKTEEENEFYKKISQIKIFEDFVKLLSNRAQILSDGNRQATIVQQLALPKVGRPKAKRETPTSIIKQEYKELITSADREDFKAITKNISKNNDKFKGELQKVYDRFEYVGNGFEVFVEYFLNLYGNGRGFRICNYAPNENDDHGIDGIGYSTTTKDDPIYVQCKFRRRMDKELIVTGSNLANLIVSAFLEFNAKHPKDKANTNLWIVTTAKGLNHYTDSNMFRDKVKCIAIGDIKRLCDGQQEFWESFAEAIKKART